MFVWGKADDGQLGLGGIEDTFIPVARYVREDTCVYVQWNLVSVPDPKPTPSADHFQYCVCYTGSDIRAE